MNNVQPILLVEDDLVDVMTVKRAFRELEVVNVLVTVSNGEEAIAYLQQPTQGLPCVILLDINMPKMNGLECLDILKEHSLFKNIPVIMLTSSKEQQDVDQSFIKGISGYILKPVDYDQFLASIQVLAPYWTRKQ
ncbi:response regulator [Methylomarinum sp. Ch1-1]|uniref:Response regulator n=1 Tax=Methylomarinum roseum TaxID=3067653 RepID=A0AAU7NWK8_9GAMM|nr:response regulator [Methylomarinum sp. Ch1-1]MDP4522565.1 response regulator [Methylomarinum sp. Ch1-1]